MRRPSPPSGGFTLIELLVVVAILAIISVMALVGLNRIIDNQAAAREQAERWQKIQLAMRLITQDLAQLQPRATREELGETYMPSILADPSAQFALEFSRGGWANPAGLPRGTVLRVAYNWKTTSSSAGIGPSWIGRCRHRQCARRSWTAWRRSKSGSSTPPASGTSCGRRSTGAVRRV